MSLQTSVAEPQAIGWPERIKPRFSDQMFGLVDLHATLPKISSGESSAQVAPDSLDPSAVLLGQTTNDLRDHTILHGLSDTLALRQGDWKYIPANAKAKVSGMGSGANASDARFVEKRIPEPLL